MKSPSRPTNVSLSTAMVDEARDLGVNISKACEFGLAQKLSEARALKWQEENREAIKCYNEYVAKNGIFLIEHRMF